MTGRQCLRGSQRALHRVPLPRGARPASQYISAATARPPTWSLRGAGLGLRPFSSASMRAKPRLRKPAVQEVDLEEDDEEPLFDKRFTTQRAHERTGRNRLPRDHEITDPLIMVSENGQVEGPLEPKYVLSRLGKEESLRMVEFYVPAEPKEGRRQKYAVTTIVNKRDEFERERASRERKQKQAKVKTKEVEITWGIGEHDLQTKLAQIGKFLGKGTKVEVILGKKRKGGKGKGPPSDAEGVLKMVREELEAMGGRESKPASGEVGDVMRMFVEAKPQKQQQQQQQKKAEESSEVATKEEAESKPGEP